MRSAILALVVGSAAVAAACSASDESHVPPPSAFTKECIGLGLSAAQCDVVGAMTLPSALPPARGNRFADDASAARLGYALFFDLQALSSSERKIRCADCHAPERGFANNVPLPTGVALVQRNALALVNAARNYPHFWDGRADSLWSQSLLTIENADEMNGNRLAVAHRIQQAYRTVYEEAFGPMPDLSDEVRFPPAGAPGSPAWETMTPSDRTAITRIFVDVGKSFEAYLRKLAAGPSPFDRFVGGETDAVSPAAKHGLAIFVRAGCIACHAGPNFSDGRFHALDLPPPSYPPFAEKVATDRGRSQGLEKLLGSEFNSLSPWFDRADGDPPRLEEDVTQVQDGMFLTPSLRNVADTAPYGHTGVFPGLEDVVRFHLKGGGPSCRELIPRDASNEEVDELVAFLRTLHGQAAPLPWSFWPPLVSGDGGANYDAASDAFTE